MDNDLLCNFRKCRKRLSSFSWVNALMLSCVISYNYFKGLIFWNTVENYKISILFFSFETVGDFLFSYPFVRFVQAFLIILNSLRTVQLHL